MKEIIGNAWMGWLDYTEGGKLTALLMIALLLFWFAKKELWIKYRELFSYTTLTAVCCICPLTATVLMLYQTKFYDYQWIWSAVPITIVIALAGTLLWTELMEKCETAKHREWKKIGVTMSMICILYFCGRMGMNVWDADKEAAKLEETAKVLEIITENGQNTNITLWAPQEIMEYARAWNGCIRMPYGRNMWDPALNAYSYETYGEKEHVLYEWMRQVEETGEGDVNCMDVVSELEISHIVLPEEVKQELLWDLEEYWGVKAQKLGTYYWICIK